jgi:hypothetical protein
VDPLIYIASRLVHVALNFIVPAPDACTVVVVPVLDVCTVVIALFLVVLPVLVDNLVEVL